MLPVANYWCGFFFCVYHLISSCCNSRAVYERIHQFTKKPHHASHHVNARTRHQSTMEKEVSSLMMYACFPFSLSLSLSLKLFHTSNNNTFISLTRRSITRMASAGGRITASTGANLLGQNAQERNQEATCFVGNLEPECTEEIIWELFVQTGRVGALMYTEKTRASARNCRGGAEDDFFVNTHARWLHYRHHHSHVLTSRTDM